MKNTKKPSPSKPRNTKPLVARKPRPAKPTGPAIIGNAAKVAFIGRSNVGKSSLINYLLGQQVAKTSKHPGKTREHSVFRFSNTVNFVDMPGYGYAIIRKERRLQWDKDLLKLFFEDDFLEHVMVLIDISISPMKIDQDFVSWLLDHEIAHSIVFTKTDKAKQQKMMGHLHEWKGYLSTLAYPIPLQQFQVSTLTKKGGGELKNFINTIKPPYPQQATEY